MEIKDICIILGKRIKEERLKLKMTQEDFSEKIKLGPKFLSNLECGKGIPSFETFIRLSKVLDVSLDSLITDYKKSKTKKDRILLQAKRLLSDLSEKQQEELLTAVKIIKNMFK